MFDRTISLIGIERYNKLKNSNILIIGVGGVGGYATEVLVRSGLENITIADYDKIDISNINRQIIALNNNIGKYKTSVLEDRILSINPNVKVTKINEKITKDNIDILFNDKYDFIIDACDSLIVKKLLIKKCSEKKINLISVCGMGKRLDSSKVKICDIRETSYDPLAKSIRKYVKDNNIKGKVMCVFSSEIPIKTNENTISSMIMVPAVAGIKASEYVIKKLIKNE